MIQIVYIWLLKSNQYYLVQTLLIFFFKKILKKLSHVLILWAPTQLMQKNSLQCWFSKVAVVVMHFLIPIPQEILYFCASHPHNHSPTKLSHVAFLVFPLTKIQIPKRFAEAVVLKSHWWLDPFRCYRMPPRHVSVLQWLRQWDWREATRVV